MIISPQCWTFSKTHRLLGTFVFTLWGSSEPCAWGLRFMDALLSQSHWSLSRNVSHGCSQLSFRPFWKLFNAVYNVLLRTSVQESTRTMCLRFNLKKEEFCTRLLCLRWNFVLSHVNITVTTVQFSNVWEMSLKIFFSKMYIDIICQHIREVLVSFTQLFLPWLKKHLSHELFCKLLIFIVKLMTKQNWYIMHEMKSIYLDINKYIT